jgi:hypothetical protein
MCGPRGLPEGLAGRTRRCKDRRRAGCDASRCYQTIDRGPYRYSRRYVQILLALRFKVLVGQSPLDYRLQ